MNWTVPRYEVFSPDIHPQIQPPSAATFILTSETTDKPTLLGPDGEAIKREDAPKPRIGFLG